MFYDVCVHKSDRLDERMLDFFLMCSARSEWKLKMKRTSKCENINNWNAEVYLPESSTFLCLCIVKRPTTYVLRMFTPFKAFVWTPICFCIGSSVHHDVAVFHLQIHVFLWQLARTPLFHWHLSPKPQLISWKHYRHINEAQNAWNYRIKINFIKTVFVSISINRDLFILIETNTVFIKFILSFVDMPMVLPTYWLRFGTQVPVPFSC